MRHKEEGPSGVCLCTVHDHLSIVCANSSVAMLFMGLSPGGLSVVMQSLIAYPSVLLTCCSHISLRCFLD